MAQSLEESEHTGAFERIHELRQQLSTGEYGDQGFESELEDGAHHSKRTQAETVPSIAGVSLSGTRDWERQDHARIGWLATIEIDESGSCLDLDPVGRRPSRKGFLPISLLKYLEIVEWSGRQQRVGKPGSIPHSLKPIFERVGFGSTGFLESMLRFAQREQYFESTERLGQPDRSFADGCVV